MRLSKSERDRLQQLIRSYVKPDAASGCWFWTGPLSRGRYGPPQGYFVSRRVRYTARRTSYLVFGGRPTRGRLKTTCGHSLCVNPVHLYATAAKASAGRPRNPS